MFEILIEERAEKDIKSIPKNISNNICKKILLLAKNPKPRGSKKLSRNNNFYRLRFGEYRILYEISEKIKIVRIFRVRHRSEVYRNLF